MRFKFKNKNLLLLYTENKNAHQYPPGIVDAFFDVMATIKSAVSEADLRALKSLHYEKLSGNREGQRSLRLNKLQRLIVQVEEDKKGKFFSIIEIVDYH
ncbi:MAG: type II toxin-antitoxin system RelE/ParE family toxin [Anaerolineaceae bacterium]|nr:plasmid maintenance system killer [Anaerolinea sp.]